MSMITEPTAEGVLHLADDRRIGYASFGPPDGTPVLWFHGSPGARRQVPQAARVAAEEMHVRIVGLDRPGVGASTPHVFDKLLDATGDIEQVTDQLGIDRFSVIGLSGGGPYVLATAAGLADRVAAGAVLGGVAPAVGPDAAEGGIVGLMTNLRPLMANLREPICYALTAAVWSMRPISGTVFNAYARFLSPPGDRTFLMRPEVRTMFLDDLLMGTKAGVRAIVYDMLLFTRHWGFDLADITTPIHWWHGDADHLVPLRHAEHTVSRLPDATLRIRPGESHLGGLDAAEEVLETLLTHH